MAEPLHLLLRELGRWQVIARCAASKSRCVNETRTVKYLASGMSNGGAPRCGFMARMPSAGSSCKRAGPARLARRTRQLRRNIADEAMIGVTGAAIGSPGDHGIGMEPLQLSGDAIRQPVEQRAIADVVAEFAIGKAEEDWRLSAKGVCRAPRLFGSRARELHAIRSQPQRAAPIRPCEPSVAMIR